jgi:hypothetical protein
MVIAELRTLIAYGIQDQLHLKYSPEKKCTNARGETGRVVPSNETRYFRIVKTHENYEPQREPVGGLGFIEGATMEDIHRGLMKLADIPMVSAVPFNDPRKNN